MPLNVRAAPRRLEADPSSWRRAALFMILTLACWSGEGFAQKILSVTPTHCKYKISRNLARDPKGELLGFECMAALTSRPAAEIACAAQKWGQEDDITVLTVRSL
jgi:hypothetical protein